MASAEIENRTDQSEQFEVIQALTTEYNDVYSLDLLTDHVTIFRFSGRAIGVKEQLSMKDGYEGAMYAYIMANVHVDDHEMMFRMTNREKIIDALRESETYTVHYRVLRGGETHYFIMKCARVGQADSFHRIILGFANEDHVMESAAALQAMEIDDLTGLYSKKAFYRHAELLLKKYPEMQFDMVISDIENFKRVNERYGRQTGDQILKVISKTLLKRYCEFEFSGRYGSDQFVTIVSHERYQDFGMAATKIGSEIPVKNLDVKFGIYEDVEHDVPASVLCDRLLIALRTIKHQFGKGVARYDEEIKRNTEIQNQIEENMQKALDEEEFLIYYQPKQNLQMDEITGAEALVRWKHSEFGFLNPGMFISLFEKNGFIKSLDAYVREKVCSTLARWIAEGKKVIPVSVNVSRRDFEQIDLAKSIIAMTDRYGLDHSLLHIEVTESCYAGNPEAVIESIRELHRAGFIIELDDFGTGYSSLASLTSMPLDVMKLDMSLIQKDDMTSERNILEFTMQLARLMNLKVVQEGVETKDQMDRLKGLGCDCIQGYYISKPLPEIEFEKYLK